MLWSVLPHAHSTYEIFSDESDQAIEEEEVNSLQQRGEYWPANWIIIGLDNDLPPVKRHFIILIDAHVFPFVHIGKRYSWFLFNMQKLSTT